MILLAAVVETILLAGLMIAIADVGAGSAALAGFLRLHDIVVGPFALLPLPGGAHFVMIGRQLGAVVGYGAFFLLLIGGVAWFDRRRTDS